MKKLIFLSLVGLAFGSCATVFTGSKKKVTFDANIDQAATLTVDGYKIYNVTFPFTMRIKGGFDETMVKAESEGYKTTQVVIHKNFNAVSVINLFDPLAWAIDAATGAMMKPEFKYYEFEFQKDDKRPNYVEQ